MTSTEQKIFNLVSTKKKIRLPEIAKEIGLTSDYVHLICQSLARRGYLGISGNYCFRSGISKDEIPREKDQKKIKEKKLPEKKIKEAFSLSNLKSLTKNLVKVLKGAGYKNIEAIARTPFSIFLQRTKLELSQAAKIFNEIRKKYKGYGE